MGGMSEYYRRLAQVTEALGDEYIGIVKITGDTPTPTETTSFLIRFPI